MKKRKIVLLAAAVIIAVVACMVLSACLPKLATDSEIVGIVPMTGVESVYGRYDAYVYGSDTQKYNMPFRLALPDNYDETKSYPLVVYLHWLGGQGDDNLTQINEELIGGLERYGEDCIVFMPQLIGEKWTFSKDFYNYKDMSDLYDECLAAVTKQYAVNTNRIYLTGVSMGARNT